MVVILGIDCLVLSGSLKKIIHNEIPLSGKYDHLVLPLRAVGNLENLFPIMVGLRVGYEIFLLQDELSAPTLFIFRYGTQNKFHIICIQSSVGIGASHLSITTMHSACRLTFC